MPRGPLPTDARLQCTKCLQIWLRNTGAFNHDTSTGHTDADWDAWRITQGVPDGQPYARFIDPDEPTPPPDPPDTDKPPPQP